MEPPTKKQKVDEQPKEGIQESDVGITVYLSPDIPGFTGVLKQRYTDFLVNEIDLDGNVLHLTDTGLKEKDVETRASEEKPKQKGKPELTQDHHDQLVEFLGEEVLAKVMELFNTGTKLESDRVVDDKEERTKLHKLVREAFSSRVATQTTSDNRFIFTLATKQSRQSSNNRFDTSHLGTVQPFVRFLMYKENKETMEVANLMSKLLKIPPRTIAYAGTKDRRGVTVQQVSISKMKVERLNGLNKTLKGIRLGHFGYSSEPLRLGDLAGNQFWITIRDVQNTEQLPQLFESLAQNGFINYYGMQRFGTFSISTHTVGKHVLNGEYEKVIELLLSPQKVVLPDSVEARQIWTETKDANKALQKMPRKCVAENAVLRAMSKGQMGINAIMQIPRNLRVMYGHAYQSYIWNNAASARISKHGMKVVPGDLVLDDTVQVDKQDEYGVDEDVKQTEFVRARVVTEEDIKTKTIFDIVLPTPGFDVLYPQNEVEDVYRDLMAADGIDYKNMTRNIKEFSLPGSYRQVVAKPTNVEYWVRQYQEPTDQIMRTDLDILESDNKTRFADTQGDKTAVVIKFHLSSSTYATMALREVMKVDTARRGDGLDVRV